MLSVFLLPINAAANCPMHINTAAFIAVSAYILAVRSLRRRYDLVYIHNMPDVLVASALLPKLLGAKVILDQHDPMPELMMTIFNRTRKAAAASGC